MLCFFLQSFNQIGRAVQPPAFKQFNYTPVPRSGNFRVEREFPPYLQAVFLRDLVDMAFAEGVDLLAAVRAFHIAVVFYQS